MNKFKIVITGPVMPEALDLMRRHCEIKQWTNLQPPGLKDLAEWLNEAEGLYVTTNMVVNEALLEAAPKLRVIAQPAVGYDNIDVAECSKRNIPFGNTPGVLVEATADLAFGILLTAARRIHEGWDWVRAEEWKPGARFPYGVDLFGKTIGIVGMGAIGSAVARRAQASGMKVIYHNRQRRADEQALKAEYRAFDSLLTESDFIVVLTPLTAESRGMFGAEQFAKMKPTAYFINAARGAIVNTDALYDALTKKQIAYAALDVTDPEPLPGDHPLIKLPNILIVPHIGSATTETRTKMALLATENLLRGLKGQPLVTCVNTEVNYRGA